MRFIKSSNVKKVYLEDIGTNLFDKLIDKIKSYKDQEILLIADHNLKKKKFLKRLTIFNQININFIRIKEELTTDFVNKLTKKIIIKTKPKLIIGIGGGTVLDCSKAISVLINNPKKAECYQGWNLLKKPGIYKIGIPSLSGTGAESSKTCVLLNKKNNLKLGFNSKFTIFDEVYLFPQLLSSVPKKLFFITAIDSFFHSFELLNGRKRNKRADFLAKKCLKVFDNIFKYKNINNNKNYMNVMIASFMGGEAISRSMTGVVHPFSAGLSSVLGINHCLANCIVFNQLEEFYPKEYKKFKSYLKIHKIRIPNLKLKYFSNKKLEKIYKSIVIHEKPLKNALGNDYKKVLDKNKVFNILRKI